jgi:hypothetical protein
MHFANGVKLAWYDFQAYICNPLLRRSPDGAVAQSVEQRTENPCVGGSIPPHTTYKSLIISKLSDFRAFLFPCPIAYNYTGTKHPRPRFYAVTAKKGPSLRGLTIYQKKLLTLSG